MPPVIEVTGTASDVVLLWVQWCQLYASNLYFIRVCAIAGSVVPSVKEISGTASEYVAHPGIKRTYSLISLNYWWPKMMETIEHYIRRWDPCQRRKENREMIAPLGDIEDPKIPCEVTSMHITGPYRTTPRGNKYLLTFIDHLTK